MSFVVNLFYVLEGYCWVPSPDYLQITPDISSYICVCHPEESHNEFVFNPAHPMFFFNQILKLKINISIKFKNAVLLLISTIIKWIIRTIKLWGKGQRNHRNFRKILVNILSCATKTMSLLCIYIKGFCLLLVLFILL